MPRRLPRPARLALTGVKVGLVGSIVVAGLATQPAATVGPGYAGYRVDGVVDTARPASARLQRLLDRHDCSVTGFPDATPASAVIRTARGRVQHVSFDVGWEVYTAHGDAQLVAVCLAEAP